MGNISFVSASIKNLKESFEETSISQLEKITASDWALEAIYKLPSLDLKAVDTILYTSEGSDFNGPQTSVWIHKRLFGGKNNVLCLDIPGGCTGFIHQLYVAKLLLDSGDKNKILGITAETVSKVIHPDDKHLQEIFSDGAAAYFVEKRQKKGYAEIGDFVFGTDSSGFESLIVRRSGIREPVDCQWLRKHEKVGGMPWGRLEMDEKAVFSFVYKTIPSLVDEILKANQLTFDDINLFVFHQANEPLLEVIKKKLKIPDEKFFTNFRKVKNTVSSSIPIALLQAQEEGKIRENYKVLIAGFGIGFSWGGTVLYY